MNLPIVSKLMEKIKGGDRPPMEKYYAIIFVLVIAFLVADIGNLFARRYFIPTNIPQKKMTPAKVGQARNYQFPGIIAKNIFNQDGVIPPNQSELSGGVQDDSAPRPSTLQLDLMGTLVHADPTKSIATINMRGQNRIEPFSVDEEVAGLAKITEIQRQRVIFRNLQNQLLEYIEVPQEQGLTLSVERGATVSLPKAAQTEQTEFTFPRAEINAQLENLPSLLQQARVVPETGPDGQVRCYKIVEMQSGSIYEKLGLRMGDCLSSVNGEAVNSPQRAMEMFQTLKNSSDIKLGVDRSGRNMDLNYRIQ
jgi:general secretion pathway protein C